MSEDTKRWTVETHHGGKLIAAPAFTTDLGELTFWSGADNDPKDYALAVFAAGQWLSVLPYAEAPTVVPLDAQSQAA